MDTYPISIPEWESIARSKIDPVAWNYVASAAADEHTMRWNVERWAAIRLAPHCLVDGSQIDTSLTLLGTDLAHPVLLAPTAAHRLVHPDGEIATAYGASGAEAVFVASTLATTSIEDIGAACSAPMWFQLYVHRDRGFTRALIQRAAAAGAKALVLTVDTAVSARDRDRREKPGLPSGLAYANLTSQVTGVSTGDVPRHLRVYHPHIDPSVSWRDIEWLREIADVPLVLKGVLRPDDAVRAAESGATAVIVSNHGGRNLDTAPATADALKGVVDSVADQMPVLVDGGIRRGTDVAKALCLGASAVLIGRPYLWGLAVAGATGVQVVVETLCTELRMTMALLGATRLSELNHDLLWHT